MTSADRLRSYLAAQVRAGWMPGAAWSVEARGRVVSRGAVGVAASGPGAQPVSEATPFDLASLTKPLATAALLVLFEQEGRLRLDTPLGEHLQEMAGSAYASASLLSLAAHTAGLPAWAPLFEEGSSLEGYVARIARRPPAVAPGRTLYSDLGYILLGAVLERHSGRRLDSLFRERVATPLGLRRTGFARDSGAYPDAAVTEQGSAYERSLAGEAGERFNWREEIPPGQVHDANAHGLGGVAGHAGLFGPVDEVARLGGELLHPRGLRLAQRAQDRLFQVVPSSQGRTVGMVLASHAAAARGILPSDAPGHTGFTGTSIWFDPAGEAVYVLLTNRIHPHVPRREFHWLRRGFHRLAAALVRRTG